MDTGTGNRTDLLTDCSATYATRDMCSGVCCGGRECCAKRALLTTEPYDSSVFKQPSSPHNKMLAIKHNGNLSKKSFVKSFFEKKKNGDIKSKSFGVAPCNLGATNNPDNKITISKSFSNMESSNIPPSITSKNRSTKNQANKNGHNTDDKLHPCNTTIGASQNRDGNKIMAENNEENKKYMFCNKNKKNIDNVNNGKVNSLEIQESSNHKPTKSREITPHANLPFLKTTLPNPTSPPHITLPPQTILPLHTTQTSENVTFLRLDPLMYLKKKY